MKHNGLTRTKLAIILALLLGAVIVALALAHGMFVAPIGEAVAAAIRDTIARFSALRTATPGIVFGLGPQAGFLPRQLRKTGERSRSGWSARENSDADYSPRAVWRAPRLMDQLCPADLNDGPISPAALNVCMASAEVRASVVLMSLTLPPAMAMMVAAPIVLSSGASAIRSQSLSPKV